MADPLSIASGIAGLLSLAGAAFHVVHQYIRTAKDAKDFVKALSKELQSLSSVLQGVKILAEAYEQDETEPSVGLRLEHISACSRVLDDILKGTETVRDSIKTQQKSITSKVENLKWPFRKSKTDDLINELARHKATLSLALDAASLSALIDCLGKVSQAERELVKIHEGVENLQILRQIQLDAERERVLNFFMPVDPSPNLQSSWKLRHPGTGLWLTESPRFRTWLSQAGSKIWVSGIPGAGKTVLAGAAIREALQQVATDSKVGVAFFFCDYKNNETWNITNILGAIATQLAWQNESAFARLKQYHDEIKPRRGTQLRPDAEDLHEVIIEESEAFDRILLVVDGLDECGDNAGEVSRVLSGLNKDISSLSSALFSRGEPDIRDMLQGQFDQIDIAARSEDVSLYVGAELEKRIEQRQLRINDTTLKDEILLRLTSGAQGMFRWVACQLDALGECVTDADRRAALYELPKTLPETYERILVRVNQKHRSVQRLVRLTLHFLALGQPSSPPTAERLCTIVSVPEQPGTKWDSSSVVTEQEVARACSSFLRKSADGRRFEFAHFSVREYLGNSSLLENPTLRPYHISEISINDTVACQLLRFLQLKNFDCKPCQNPGDQCGLCTDNENLGPLYRLAASEWPRYVHSIQDRGCQSSTELLDLQKSLFYPEKSNAYMNWATRFCSYLDNQIDIEYVHDFVLDSGLSTLHVAAALDLTEVGTWLLGLHTTIDSGIEAGSLLEFSIAGIYALVVNAEISKSPTVRFYEDRSRTVSLMDQLSSCGETLSESSKMFQGRKLMRVACIFATRQEMSPLKCLLENGWKLCSEDISIASNCFQEGFSGNSEEHRLRSFVRFLNTRGIYKTREGHELCALIWNMAIRLDLNFTADTSLLPSDITLSNEALIETAVKAIKYDDLQTLVTCEQDARFNIRELKDKDGVYAIHIAASCNALKTLKYMINAGCEIQRSDYNGRNFLHVWAIAPKPPTFDTSALLEETREQHGAEFEKLMGAINRHGQTALDMAFEANNMTAAKWLFEKCGKELGCCHGKICIWDAAANAKSIAFLQMLKDSDFPCHTDCSNGQPFHSLNSGTNLERFELLNALYPNSLKSRTSTKLVLENCLSKWARQEHLDPYEIDIRVIRALLHNSDTLSPTSPAAIEFCCRIISDTSPSSFNPIIKIIELFLEHGIDVHPWPGSTSILEKACTLFNMTLAQKRNSYIHLLEAILDRVDNKKLNRHDRYGSSILHQVCTMPGIDPEWLVPEIVKRGADINITSGQFPHKTPLLDSLNISSKQPIRSAQILLELGANPALLSSGAGWDAAQTASIRGLSPFLQDLLAHLTKTSTSFDWERKCSVSVIWEDSRRNLDGLNSMQLACIEGHQDCFNFFLDNRLINDIHALTQEGFNCLHFAACGQNTEFVNFLLDLGLDINQMAVDGSTPLHMAVRTNNRRCVERLLSRGSLIKRDVVGMTPMMYARQLNLDDIVGLLAGFDTSDAKTENPDARTRNAKTRYWRKALETAILKNDARACSRILEEGCSVNVSLPACGGCSPLLLSIRKSSPKHCELVRLFLEHSASVCKQACSRHGSNSALLKALHRHHLTPFLPLMLDLCLHEGLDFISAQLLVKCIRWKNDEAFRIIVDHVCANKADYARFLGCRPDHVLSCLLNNYGDSMPLHQAVIENNLKVVKQLVQGGADVDGQDSQRMTPIQYCEAPGAIAEYLLSMGATPTLPPSITWLHHLGNSAQGQTRMTAELFRQAPIKLIYEPVPPNPTLHPKVLAAIMDSGQDLNAEEESNRNIMLVAMHNPETATMILNKPAQLTETGPFPWSMMGCMIEDASWMNQHWKHYIRRFRMEDLRRVSNLEPRRGWSPLCLATCTDAVKVMEHCLEMGTDIDFEGSPYGSALMAAAGMNRIESVKFLVRHGASICYEGKEGFTSAVVVGASSQRVVQWLLVSRFQDQGKLEAVSESSTIITENVPIHSWSPARVNFRLAGEYERRPAESSLDYLKALAAIKKDLRGQVVYLPKPEFLETSVVTAVYDI